MLLDLFELFDIEFLSFDKLLLRTRGFFASFDFDLDLDFDFDLDFVIELLDFFRFNMGSIV